MNFKLLASAALLLAFLPARGEGQNLSIDENVFRIYKNGEVVGREEFSIRQIGPQGQQKLILRGRVDMDLPQGPLHLAPAMEAQAGDLEVTTYQIKVSGAETTDIFVNVSDNRFMARIVSSVGEQLREFRAGPGSVLLDDGVVHHYYLLKPFLDEGSPVSLTVLNPRAGRQQRMTLSLVGEEEIRVGGALVPDARRFRLEGGGGARDIWFDGQGRILRLEISGEGFLAERETLS